MSAENTIFTEIKGQVATIWLNRPEKHNALNMEMLSGFLNTIGYLNSIPRLRIVIIRGKGMSFCSGADLKWMQHASGKPSQENYNECEILARCYFEWYHCKMTTICLIHGSSFGGANGFIAGSDIALAADNAIFAFSEVRVGVVPATITPYVIAKIGSSKAMELMLTGSAFSAGNALSIGLVNKIAPPEQLDEHLSIFTKDLLLGAPSAQKTIKTFIHSWQLQNEQPVIERSAKLLATSRITAEAKEGINAFLEKRKPQWNPEIQ